MIAETMQRIKSRQMSWTIAPFGLGVLDATDQMNCSPSAYYESYGDRLLYVEGYLSVKPRNRGALALHATYTTDDNTVLDELYDDCLTVDDAQANEFDWRI